jgi:hypothetical protein
MRLSWNITNTPPSGWRIPSADLKFSPSTDSMGAFQVLSINSRSHNAFMTKLRFTEWKTQNFLKARSHAGYQIENVKIELIGYCRGVTLTALPTADRIEAGGINTGKNFAAKARTRPCDVDALAASPRPLCRPVRIKQSFRFTCKEGDIPTIDHARLPDSSCPVSRTIHGLS